LKNHSLPLSIKIQTARSLGILNIFKVFVYRIQCKTGYFEKCLPRKELLKGPLFYESNQINSPDISEQSCQKISNCASQISNGQLTFFSHDIKKIGHPPNWFCNPYNHKIHRKRSAYWSFANDPTFGDIKIIWEMSRMDWALVLSKMAALSQNNQYIQLLNYWLENWIDNNMPQTGPNWLCAQETAIRLIQIILCAQLLNQKKPLPALIDFVDAHCQRIALTRHYADAQQNNHAISEAAGLFIGGLWLKKYAQLNRKAHKWQNDGHRDLEWLISKLIADDGSFAQHSLNYHRVLISTISMVEYFRQFFKVPAFSTTYYNKVCNALLWLYQMVDPKTGNGSNLGANDGARVYAFSESSYTDYRPEIQLASCLFMEKFLYRKGDWDEPIQWLQLDPDRFSMASIRRKSRMYPDGGYVTFVKKFNNSVPTWGMIRCPNDRFRPHHADAFHFDLWIDGINVFRDSGSYSYDITDSIRANFISSSAHNTASFDTHDQMPVVSRFLYGKWIKAKTVRPILSKKSGHISWRGEYFDYMGCYHQRHIFFDNKKWCIVDKLAQFNHKAVIRWRLMNDNWMLSNYCLTGRSIKIQISTDVKSNIALTNGFESLCYMEQTQIPVLELCVLQSPAIVTTVITLVYSDEHV